jgi:hypothetical protein
MADNMIPILMQVEEDDFDGRSIAGTDVVLSDDLSALGIEACPLEKCLRRMREDIDAKEEGSNLDPAGSLPCRSIAGAFE